MKGIATFLISLFLTATCYAEIKGNPEDVKTETTPCLTLFGGGNVDEGFKWMIEKSGGGDFLVIGWNNNYNEKIYNLGKVNSVETIIVSSRKDANSPENIQKIKNAEAIFIAGGNQSHYIEFWKNSKLLEAINEKVNKIPVGGLSAGMAILGEYYYASTPDEHCLSSEDALNDPFHEDLNKIGNNFLHIDLLKNTITDTHYSERDRQGRHVAFMSRLIEKNKVYGIGIDEFTAVCIDVEGKAKIVGEGCAFFLEAIKKPEQCEKDKPLTWNHDGKAIRCCVARPKTNFCIKTWSGGKQEYWCVVNGELKRH